MPLPDFRTPRRPSCAPRCRVSARRTIRWTSPAVRCCSPICSSRGCASWAGSRSSPPSPACSTCRSRQEHATEFVLTALRHIAAGLHAADVPALMISHTVKPVTEVSTTDHRGDRPALCQSRRLHHGMNALGHAFWWSEQYRRARAAHRRRRDDRSRRASARVPNARRWIFLARREVPVVPATLATRRDQAIAAARAIGGRVVLKIASDDIAHKSDIGGVVLNLEGDAAVADAFARVMAAAPASARVDGVLVAPMRSGGLELFVGCTRDPQWGPVIAVGLGGVWVEVLQDVSLRPLPIDAAEVKRMLGRIARREAAAWGARHAGRRPRRGRRGDCADRRCGGGVGRRPRGAGGQPAVGARLGDVRRWTRWRCGADR